MLTPLLFALALGILGLLFRVWVQRRGFDPFVAFSALGFVLLTAALFTYAYAMRTACHGEFDFLRNAFACAHR